MLGVHASTLTRRKTPTVAVGHERRVPPSVVLTEAAYRKRPLDEVGHDLIEHARTKAPDTVAAVEAEVDSFFEGYHPPAPDRTQWLEDARKFLPPELFERVSTSLGVVEPSDPPSDGDTEERDAIVAQTS